MKNISKFLGLALIATSATSFAASMPLGTSGTVDSVAPQAAHHGYVEATANTDVNVPFTLPVVTATGYNAGATTSSTELAKFTLPAAAGQRACLQFTNLTTDIPGDTVSFQTGAGGAKNLNVGTACGAANDTTTVLVKASSPLPSGHYATRVVFDIYAD
ncbi:TPA: hypothetical protein G8O67_004633 [Salmonella enterica]|uniref:Fimbrial protein n=1 Tax=Salmonella enterica TaxID=28901 RepID=A0A756L9P4_SALER|nr:hypothetical protein [Salmonella enterica]